MTTTSGYTGKLIIELPDNTNKNVAYILSLKYMSTQLQSTNPLGGYWGSGNVLVEQDYNTKKLYMIFKLY